MFNTRTQKILAMVNNNETESIPYSTAKDLTPLTPVIVDNLVNYPGDQGTTKQAASDESVNCYLPVELPFIVDADPIGSILPNKHNHDSSDARSNDRDKDYYTPSEQEQGQGATKQAASDESVNYYLPVELPITVDADRIGSILPNEHNHDSSDAVSDDRDKDYTPSEQAQDTSDEDDDVVNNSDIVNADNTENQRTCRIKRVGGGRKKTTEENRTRKRVRQEKSWEVNIRKEKKERGEEYITKTGKVKNKKKIQQPCQCKRKCYNKISDTQRNNMFNAFYALSRDGQDQFIAETVEESLKERETIKSKEKLSRRKHSRKYYLNINKGVKLETCQKMYLSTFDLTLKKVRVIVEKKRKSEGHICPTDSRGKHGSHKKIADEKKNLIRKHIESIPAYTSHYSRERTSKKYLSPDLSISMMYRLYCDFCKKDNILPERECQYRKIFTEEYNLCFHAPANDTCAKCDRINLALKSLANKNELSQQEETEKQELVKERNKHLDLAEKAYKHKSEDKARSKDDPQSVTCSFDLEKCLPTPYLRNGISFYKRQLWSFNLTFYHTSSINSAATCFLWNETIAGRGGQEIASCVRKYVLSLPSTVKILNFYSDSCSGQNKNVFMVTMFCVLMNELKLQDSSITEINHKFMEPGHTHMEADTIHAAIETAKKKTTADIEVPHDWCNFIKTIYRKKTPLTVVEMQQSDFLNFGALLNTVLVHRKKNEDGNITPWMQMKWLKFEQEKEFQFSYKTSFNDDEPFKNVDLRRGQQTRRNKNIKFRLEPLHTKPLPLADMKVSNLLDLLPYVSDYNKPFYENLTKSSELNAEDIPDSAIE